MTVLCPLTTLIIRTMLLALPLIFNNLSILLPKANEKGNNAFSTYSFFNSLFKRHRLRKLN